MYFAPGAVFVSSTALPHLVLILGATISLVSFLGYYGTMNEKRWVLWLHVFLLLVIIALQIAVGSVAFVYRKQGSEVLNDAWERVYRSDPRGIQDLENFVSLLLVCCHCPNLLSCRTLNRFFYSSSAAALNMCLIEQSQ